MMISLKDFTRLTLKARRRLMAGAICGMLLAGVALGAAGAPATGGAASHPVAASSNKDASKAQYLKAKDLYDAGKYADAQVENDKALALDPTNVDATLMKRVLDSKVTSGAGGTVGGPSAKPGVLTTAQISMIRIMELGSGDNPANVRGKIDRSVLEDFWSDVITKDSTADKSKQAHDAFLNPANFAAQVARIKDSGDMKYMEKVTITSDPVVMMAYRTVNTYALQNCATAECHGGDKGGNFRLLSGTQPEQIYTNFYVMSMYANQDGKMIDRDNPEKSLLLQYSLPWASSSAKHPEKDIRKMASPADARYRSIIDWIRALAVPRPNYGISMDVPSTTTQAAQ